VQLLNSSGAGEIVKVVKVVESRQHSNRFRTTFTNFTSCGVNKSWGGSLQAEVQTWPPGVRRPSFYSFYSFCLCFYSFENLGAAAGGGGEGSSPGPGAKARAPRECVAACMRAHAHVGMHPEIQPRNINQATIVIILIIIKPVPASQLHGVHVPDGGGN